MTRYRVFAIGDLHLPGADNKTMDVFGPTWQNHRERMKEQWDQLVRPEDYVLCPGDISWAMNLVEAEADLAFLGQLPGKIIMIKGNHDYWWQSITQLRAQLPANVQAIQNDFVALPGNLAVCGTRGWLHPEAPNFSIETDTKIYQREVNRLRLSLDAAVQVNRKPTFVMLHYPPFTDGGIPSGFTELLEEREVPICVYGHLHGYSITSAITGLIQGTDYHLVSADALGFAPKLIGTFPVCAADR